MKRFETAVDTLGGRVCGARVLVVPVANGCPVAVLGACPGPPRLVRLCILLLLLLLLLRAHPYGVRPSRTQSLGDQLGLFLGTKSKIADRSGMETLGGHVTTVADFPP